MSAGARPPWGQVLIGAGTLALAGLLAVGAGGIASDAGYSGIGPNFLPWALAALLALCGATLLAHALTGGYRQPELPTGAAQGDWRAFAWVSAGLLANALLITHIGFVLACTICFALAVRGLRRSEARPTPAAAALRDAVLGLAIAAPVYWTFTKLLGVGLPGLTTSGWI